MEQLQNEGFAAVPFFEHFPVPVDFILICEYSIKDSAADVQNSVCNNIAHAIIPK
jgi:hypothetical protein